jgi:ketosteroid isomerase-like protein
MAASRSSEREPDVRYDDESAIRRVIFDYAWAIDTKDWPALGACFTEVCDVTYGGGDPSLPHPHETGRGVAFTNRDDFVAYVARTHEPILSFHMMGATAIELESAELATARTYARLVLAPRDAADGGRFESAGAYEDVLRKEDGIWRLSARHYTRMWADGNAAVLRHDRG